MTAAELAAATADLQDVDFNDTQPVATAEQLQHHPTGKRLGKRRKLPWEHAMRLLERADPELLKRADKIADRNDLKRSELLARALAAVIAAMNEPRAMKP